MTYFVYDPDMSAPCAQLGPVVDDKWLSPALSMRQRLLWRPSWVLLGDSLGTGVRRFLAVGQRTKARQNQKRCTVKYDIKKESEAYMCSKGHNACVVAEWLRDCSMHAFNGNLDVRYLIFGEWLCSQNKSHA